jgi:hypothetical protein
MIIPRIEIGLQDESIKLSYVTGPSVANRIESDIRLDELNADGLDAAGCRIGAAIFDKLQEWAPDKFVPFPGLVDDAVDERSAEGLAHSLIHQCVTRATKVHVPSIEFLLTQEAANSERARTFLRDSWPVIRSSIERLPD